MDYAIEAKSITKRFGAYTALDRVDLDVRAGELLALLGPSGSGKTTLLRIMAGLEFADSGRIRLFDDDVTERGPGERKVGFVFQHYALFRHMTVFDNVAFGLTVRPHGERPARGEIAQRVNDLLKLVQLDWIADRYPTQLSGGQRQRVALARALAVQPKVLLLDEPFGALDAKVRKELRRWLRRLHDEMHITSVFVTHDQEEALELADRVVVMSQGRVEQVGSPTEVYDAPATPFVYDFLGNVNRLEGEVEDGVLRVNAVPVAEGGEYRGAVSAFVRPHDIDVVHPDREDEAGSGSGSVSVSGRGRGASIGADARITHVQIIGPSARLELNLAGQILEAEMDRERLRSLGLFTGDRCRVRLPRLRLFTQNPTGAPLHYDI